MKGKCTSFVEELVQELHSRISSKHVSTPVPVLPEEILAEILTRLPVKVLVQCKSVCKSWARLLSDPVFINNHLHFNSPKRIILSNRLVLSNQGSIYSISISLPLNPNPNSVLNTQRLCPPLCPRGFSIKGYCNGLLVIVNREKSIILWNPSISRSRVLSTPPFLESPYYCGFARDICAIGYDSSKDDYKIITSTYFNDTWSVQVLSLNSNLWRKLPDAEFPPYHMETFFQLPVSINGAIYWTESEKVFCKGFNMILRFDVCQERFSLVPPPPDDTRGSICWIGDINHSLCTHYNISESYFHIWSTQDDFNWVKLITVSKIPEPNPRAPYLYYAPLCFNENGELLISLCGYGTFHRRRGLVAYDPKEQSYRRFVLEENIHWLEETIYSDSLVFPNEPLVQTCSPSSSGSLKQMLLRFSHTTLSRFACNATSRKRL